MLLPATPVKQMYQVPVAMGGPVAMNGWADVLKPIVGQGAQTGFNIIGTRWAVPQVQPGTSIQEPGRILVGQTPGYPILPPPAGSVRVETGWPMGLTIAGAAVAIVVVMVMTRGGGSTRGGK